MEEEKKNKTQDVGLSEKLMKTRSVMISGEINKDAADDFAQRMLVLDSLSQDPIYVYINSPGGDVDSGFAIYDMIRYVESPVTVVGMGPVASAAALIYLSVPSERRLALPNSTYLIHQPLSQLKGTAIEIDIYARKLEEGGKNRGPGEGGGGPAAARRGGGGVGGAGARGGGGGGGGGGWGGG
ncbi:MAG: ATP-dependent Clp protease proteolytic subunit, partial [Sphaerochaetaceae bacterium]|nr:ATP-dependent Clp protease proteolytic subunit [Sphaerochaetaceae bacterium]